MIGVNYLYIFIFALFIFIISFLFNHQLEGLKKIISILISNNSDFKTEIKTLKEENIILEKNLLFRANNEKSLNMKILQLERLRDNTKITEEELSYFANNLENSIELSMCDKNAYKVYEKFGGKVRIGKADVLKNDKFSHETNGHLWNVISYSDDNIEKEQLVDILKYKENQDIFYTNHRGQDIPIEEVLTAEKFNYL
ncbi:MAG: hypothetical protein Q7S59_00425 [Sulfurimonas sp.]|nr:hypothetical protein [Sulfurimonas sp.]